MANTRNRFGRFSGAYGSPVRVISLGGASTREPGVGTDTTAKVVDQLGESVKRLQDAEKLAEFGGGKLSPQELINYAQMRVSELGPGHPDTPIWQKLITDTKNKMEQDQWSEDIKNGTKTLEQFGEYLNSKASSATPGSPEAAGLINALNANKNAIQARDEAKKDMTAQISYINSGDHKAYKDYLTSKLARTTDTAAQKTIVGQIDELNKRIASQDAADRAQKMNDIITAYRSHDWTASQAVQALHDLAQSSKGITDGEVRNIDTAVNGIYNLEDSRIKAAGTASTAASEKAAQDTVENARIAFQTAVGNIVTKANDPNSPNISQEDLNTLHATRDAFSRALQSAMNNTTNPTLLTRWGQYANSLPQQTITAEQTVDKAATRGLDVTQPVSELTKDMKDPQQIFNALGNRQQSLNAALNQTITTQGRKDIEKALDATVAARQGAVTMSASKLDTGTPDSVLQAWDHYRKDATPDKQGKTIIDPTNKVTLDEFKTLFSHVNSAAEFNALVGYKPGVGGISDQTFRENKFNVENPSPDVQSLAIAKQMALSLATDPSTPNGSLSGQVINLASQAAGRQGSLASGSEGPHQTGGERGALSDPAQAGTSGLPDWFLQQIGIKGPQPKQPDLASVYNEPIQNTQPMGSQPAFDPGMMDQQQPPEQQQDTPYQQSPDAQSRNLDAQLDPTTNANNMLDYASQSLNQDTPMDLPGFTVPNLPDVSPFAQTEPFDWLTSDSWSNSNDPYAGGGPFDGSNPGDLTAPPATGGME